MSKEKVILIVEDNPADVRLMREALREMKSAVDIRVAPDGDAAIQFLRREGAYTDAPAPSLVFLDFNLPKADSRDVLRQIKHDRILRTIPVAVITTSDAEHDVCEAYDLHANCYLRKPPDLDSFLHTIHEAANFWLNVAFLADISGSNVRS